ncbi:glutamate ABC transporter substrate-binding protein [Kitasatospora sp. NPDC085879]|uniref:glutamate ABC transporter substrate-binding protein n=1 Tax=Kitasatospora sp. NPDC085879 TaxID=3154769 RepID=UPI003414816B
MTVRTVTARGMRAGVLATVVAVAAGLLAGGPDGRAAQDPPVQAAPAAAALAPAADCDVTKSAPPAEDPNGSAIRRIRQRGSLVVGVDQNSFNWGYRNPRTGRIEGFDIDLAHAIAASVLGDPERITFRTVPTARRIDAIKNGEVDLITRTMTITCDRLKEVAFSVPYFRTGQQVVVPRAAKVPSLAAAFKGRRACVAAQSSSEAELKRDARGTSAVRVVENQLDCLVLMQLGQVDTTLTDGALAAAQAAQDPTVQVLDESISDAYMGVAVNRAAPDLVAWVNQVLAEYRSGGGWQRSYARWLAPTMGASTAPYLP